VVPLDVARRLTAGIARAHLSYVWGAAHVPELDQPDRTARLIGAFLEHGEGFLVRRPDQVSGVGFQVSGPFPGT
jgi:hypothetical protein